MRPLSGPGRHWELAIWDEWRHRRRALLFRSWGLVFAAEIVLLVLRHMSTGGAHFLMWAMGCNVVMWTNFMFARREMRVANVYRERVEARLAGVAR